MPLAGNDTRQGVWAAVHFKKKRYVIGVIKYIVKKSASIGSMWRLCFYLGTKKDHPKEWPTFHFLEAPPYLEGFDKCTIISDLREVLPIQQLVHGLPWVRCVNRLHVGIILRSLILLDTILPSPCACVVDRPY
jgi:hypothetical protein